LVNERESYLTGAAGIKVVDNLLQQIEQSKQAGLAKNLFGLGIRHVGERTASRLPITLVI
jgi:NAD-dependent DNA ligase